VHRLLESCLVDLKLPVTTDSVNSVAKQCNVRKFASKDAQDMSQNLYLVAYLSKIQEKYPEGIIAEAYVNGIGSRSFDVLIPSYGIETRIWLEDSLERGEIAGVESNGDSQKLKVYWLRERRRTIDNSTASANDHYSQTIGMFDKLNVLIIADMKKSPPSYKVFAVPPK
jgi:exoribonuclease R